MDMLEDYYNNYQSDRSNLLLRRLYINIKNARLYNPGLLNSIQFNYKSLFYIVQYNFKNLLKKEIQSITNYKKYKLNPKNHPCTQVYLEPKTHPSKQVYLEPKNHPSKQVYLEPKNHPSKQVY